MEKWTRGFNSKRKRRSYIRSQKKRAKSQGHELIVLDNYFVRWRCTGKVTYFTELTVK